MNEKLKKRLEKLLAMTKSTNEHEVKNAESRIRILCVKHDVDIDELLDESEAVEMHWYRYDNTYVKDVLKNTIWKATNINTFFKNRSRQRQVGVKCTKSQAAEIDLWWSVMRAAFKQHLDDTVSAFIIANDLFGEPEEREFDYDDFDWDAYRRQQELAEGIDKTHVLKRLE